MELEEQKKKWKKEQEELKKQLISHDCEKWALELKLCTNEESDGLRYVGGVDISFIKSDETRACAALVIQDLLLNKIVYEDISMVDLTVPYIAGFLAFREVPLLLDKFNKLKVTHPDLYPQVVMVDGNGLLHHRKFGMACHLGVLLDLPCLGVAKNLLRVPGIEMDDAYAEKVKMLKSRGDSFPLIDGDGDCLGKALKCSENSKKPVYVSLGHKLSLDASIWVAVTCSRQFRIPEPTRQADIISREYLRKLGLL